MVVTSIMSFRLLTVWRHCETNIVHVLCDKIEVLARVFVACVLRVLRDRMICNLHFTFHRSLPTLH